MKYRHKVTGAVIDVESVMGGDWQEIDTPARPAPATKPAPDEPKPAKGAKKDARTVRKPG